MLLMTSASLVDETLHTETHAEVTFGALIITGSALVFLDMLNLSYLLQDVWHDSSVP